MVENQASSSSTGTTGATGTTTTGATSTTATTGATGTQQTTQRTDTGTTGTQTTGATQATDTAARTALASTTDTQVTAPADWPADWREKLAGGDEKKLAALKRYASPQAYSDAGFQLRGLMDSKQLRAPAPPADAKPEDVALWRKENGIPEKADGYLQALDRNIVIGDDDKPIVGKFLEAMHAKNASPDVVNAALGSYYQIQEMLQTEQVEQDNQIRQKAEDELRPEWGNEYRRNINVINGFLDTAPQGVKDTIMNARGPDGSPLASDPNVLRFLLTAAASTNPLATVVPGQSGSQAMQTIDGEIKQIETLMREKRHEYDRDPKIQQRYLELLRAKEKVQQGSRAA